MDMELDDICCGIGVGADVPNFTLETWDPAQGDFGTVSLDELTSAGRWTVLVFYPADFTFVCPTELADVGNVYAELRSAGAEVISVSTDTKFVHMAWQQGEKLLERVTYPMAADPTGEVSRLFGVYDEDKGEALRGTFIISPEGRLVASEINYADVGRNAKELVRKVRAYVYVSQHPDQACPANWVEGGKTLKPGKDLVGKVFEAL